MFKITLLFLSGLSAVSVMASENNTNQKLEEYKIKDCTVCVSTETNRPSLPYQIYSRYVSEKDIKPAKNSFTGAYYSNDGKQWIAYYIGLIRYNMFLNKPIDVSEETVIEVEGEVKNLKKDEPVILSVMNSKVVFGESQELKKNALEKYIEIRKELEAILGLATKKVKLRLPLKKNFLVSWDTATKKIILSTSSSDLMWVCDIFFVMDAKEGKIEKIYAQRWFKGE